MASVDLSATLLGEGDQANVLTGSFDGTSAMLGASISSVDAYRYYEIDPPALAGESSSGFDANCRRLLSTILTGQAGGEDVIANKTISGAFAFAGDSDLGPETKVTYAAAETFSGDSNAEFDAFSIYNVALGLDGEADALLDGTVDYAATTAMIGSSTGVFNSKLTRQLSAVVEGASDATADAFIGILSEVSVESVAAGVSVLTVNPGGVLINRFSRGPKVPTTAAPVTIPVVRIVPPAPPVASYAISPSNRNRRREER